MQILQGVIIQLFFIVVYLMSYSLAFGDSISKTGGNYLIPVRIANPGDYTSSVTISDLPSGAKITNVKAVYSYGHCPYDDLKVTLSKSRGDATPLQLMDDWTPAYVTQNWTRNEGQYFANANPNDTWSLKTEITGNGCPSATCNPSYHGHEGYFYEWTLTITYDTPPSPPPPPPPVVQPVTAAPSLGSPAIRYFTGSTSTTNVGFSWASVPNATSYKLDIFDAITGSLVQEETPTTTSFSSTSLTPLKRYSWQVAGVNSVTPTGGPLSETRKFIIGPTMECFPEIGSGNGVNGAQTHIDTCYDLSSSTGNYLLKDISRREDMNVDSHNGKMSNSASIMTQLYNTSVPIQTADNIWVGAISGVDAHVNAGKVYDYLLSELGLSSPDGKRNSLNNIVESQDSRGCPDNAFFDPAPSIPTVQYCAGTTYSSSLDIVAHEWGHAVTRLASSRGAMTYAGESGALNEAFSDWIGTAIKQANGDFSWSIIIGTTIRSLSNPTAGSLNPRQPDTYGVGPYWINTYNCIPNPYTNDFCGVHYNSGVPNKMFFLLSNPGMNTHNNITTAGIGIDKAIKIAYLANMNYWGANATFAQARDGMVRAAESIHGPASWEASQVSNAWAAVGVTSTTTPSSVAFRRLVPVLHLLLGI